MSRRRNLRLHTFQSFGGSGDLGHGTLHLEQAVTAAKGVGKGIFWLGEPDGEILFRHLRRLGAARIPDGRILYFRHYDPDVLASIVPMLDATDRLSFWTDKG